MSDLLSFLKEKEMTPVNIQFIKDPNEFYERLICHSNSTYISIITLYLGTQKEDEKILKKLTKCKNLALLSDSIVNHRTDPSNLLKELNIYDKIKAQVKNINIPLLRELLCVQHCKMYVFDDNIILTGANFESRYFSTTLDNYWEIKSAKLASEILELMSCYDKRFIAHKKFLNTIIQFRTSMENVANDTFVKPYTHKEEYELLKQIVEYADGSMVYISTGYLNFPRKYLDIFKNKNVRIYCPPAKSTFRARGRLGAFVISIYTYIYNRTKDILGGKIFIYDKKGFNFHKKGVWVFKGNTAIHILGSSNFNMRSYQRDYELNYILVTTNTKVKNQLWQVIKDNDDNSKPLKSIKYSLLQNILFEIVFFLVSRFM